MGQDVVLAGAATRRAFLRGMGGALILAGLGAACQSASPAATAPAPTSPAASPAAGVPGSPSPAASVVPAVSPQASPSAVRSVGSTTTLTYGHPVGSVTEMSMHIADGHGFFDEYGIKLNPTVLQTSTETVQALVSNSIDWAALSPPSLVVAYAKGATDLTLIGCMEDKVPYTLMAAKDVTGYADLKGKTIGISSFGDGLTVLTRMLLAQNGLSDSDYNFIAMGASPSRAAGLESNGVSAVIVGQPYDFQLVRDGYVRLGDTTQVEANYSFGGMEARRSWISQNMDLATRALAATLRGQQYFIDPANRDAVLQDMQSYVQISAEDAAESYDLLVTQLHAFPADLTPTNEGMQAVIDVSVRLGDIDPPGPSVAELSDLDPLRAAQTMLQAGASRSSEPGLRGESG